MIDYSQIGVEYANTLGEQSFLFGEKLCQSSPNREAGRPYFVGQACSGIFYLAKNGGLFKGLDKITKERPRPFLMENNPI